MISGNLNERTRSDLSYRQNSAVWSAEQPRSNERSSARVVAVDGQRRQMRIVVTTLIALTLALMVFGLPANAQVIAFKQAVAEASANDRDLAGFYKDAGYEPVWTGADARSQARRQALLRAMNQAAAHGLPTARYDADSLMATLASANSPRALGLAEIEMSRMFLKLARDMQSGVLQPNAVDDNIKREVTYRDPEVQLATFKLSDPHDFFRALAPQTNEYTRLMKEKLRLEALIAQGGWGAQVSAKSLKSGDTGAQVVALRDRLVRMGYMSRSVTQTFDKDMHAAILAYQTAHGLEVDGEAAKNTLRAINISAPERLKSVIVAMERERWLNQPEGKGKRHILVNLTDFSARIMDNDRETFRTRAVIGAVEDSRESPEFSDEMEHMVINPTWHVPRSIAVKEYLPQLKRNRNAVGHLRLVDSKGRTVNRGAVNFNNYSARTFPFAIKQPPSKSNALGLVKFMFPNKYNIYLHDTPAKDLFSREVRAYSHGCIRLADPFDFAYELLSKQESDPVGFFHTKLDTGNETYVNLKAHVPVHIIYRTAVSDDEGKMSYRADIYGRDAKIWSALEQAGVSLNAVQG